MSEKYGGPPPSYDGSGSGQPPAAGYPNQQQQYYQGQPQPPQYSYPAQQGQPQYPYGVANTGTHNVIVQPMPTNQIVVTSVDNNLGLAIIATILCFWPLGIVAIIKAVQVSSALAMNDIAGAQKLAADSRRLSLISVGIGSLLITIIIILNVVIISSSG